MKNKYKILVTDIQRGSDLEKNLSSYSDELAAQYNCYAMVKMSMNYYTMKEMLHEQDDHNMDVCKYFRLLTELVQKHITDTVPVDEKAIETVRQLRENVEYKMRVLTAYTDGYEIYEYILNRIEAGVRNTTEEVNPEILSQRIFDYIFSENDTVVVNSKLQLVMAQLPVRMTKKKLYDIIANTLMIYNGTEKKSAAEFVDMLRSAVMISIPKGFDTEYPYLYHVYNDLVCANYNDMTLELYEELTERLKRAAEIVSNEVSALMLMQEIINDIYAILLTNEASQKLNIDKPGCVSAKKILKGCISSDNPDDMLMGMTDEFVSIEGVQEGVYENIIVLESSLDDIKQEYRDKIDYLGLKNSFDTMSLVSKLLSTSLFINIDKDCEEQSGEIADSAYIAMLRDTFIQELKELFDGKDRRIVRSIMSKLLAAMPVFMNSRQEIKSYFDYVLGNCGDESELAACRRLLENIMED